MSIYAINYGVGQYAIGEAQLRACLGDAGAAARITVTRFDALDLDALASARFLVAPRFDTDAIRRHAPRLELAHCINAGVERFMPLDWLPPGAVLTNSSGIHAGKAREYALMAILMLNAAMPRFIGDQARHAWRPRFTAPARGKRLLVVGTGGIGAAVAQAGRDLGLHVTGVSRSGRATPGFERVVARDGFDAVLPDADFVVLACPLTPDTRGLLSAERIARMQPGAGIVNMARGAVADYAAIAAALARDALCGCIADVFDAEPLPADAPLWDAPGFVVTPHVSCDAPTGYVEAGLAIFGANVRAILRGDAPSHVVDPALGY